MKTVSKLIAHDESMKQTAWFMVFAAALMLSAAVIESVPAVSVLMLPVMLLAYYNGELWEVRDDG